MVATWVPLTVAVMVAMPLSSWAVKLLIAPLVEENQVPSVAVMSVVMVGA